MKKFYAFAAAALAAISMNAQVYVMGAGDGIGWDFPGMKVDASSENVYTFTISNLTKFKVSTVEADNWDSFNEGAYATGNATFTEAVYPDGQTLPVEPWGEDQELPWTGNYTITLDLNAMTMTAKALTPKPTGAPDVFLRGDMNGWGTGDQWKFTSLSWDAATGTGVYQIFCTVEKTQAFKVADASWGSINYGGGTISQYDGTPVTLQYNSSGNTTFSKDFTGKIVFTITGTKQAQVQCYEGDDSVEMIESDNVAPVYYNLQGVRVDNPADGLYIVVRGNNVTKEVIR